jgi:hypothetical protein
MSMSGFTAGAVQQVKAYVASSLLVARVVLNWFEGEAAGSDRRKRAAMIGQTIAHYHVTAGAKFGAGGMGEIYLAVCSSRPSRVPRLQ